MTRTVLVLLTLVVLLASLPAVAAAETRTGGTVIVGPNETVDEDLETFAGSVVIRGTVDGDLSAFAGDIRIAQGGTVTGDVETAGGSVVIAGTVGGDVEAAGGSVRVTETGQIDGALEAGAGSVTVNGTVGGDAQLGADSIRLGPGARIGGDLIHDGDLTRAEGATVEGTVTRDDDLDAGVGGPIAQAPGAAFTVYSLLVNLLVGAVLLLAFPWFSEGVADRVADDPVRTGAIGLVAAIAIPIGLVLLLFTILGIPLSLAGFVIFGLLTWIGTIYGRYAVGEWVLSFTGRDNRWLALLIGVVSVALLTLVPLVGWLVELVVFVLGFGALVTALWRSYDNRNQSEPTPSTDVEAV